MKIYYSVLFLLALNLTGCYSTYSTRGYSSKDKFYRDFVSSADTKDLNITLLNDSLVQTTGGVKIKNDTLFTSTDILPIKNIKTINYKNTVKSTIFGLIIGDLVAGISLAPIFANNVNPSNFMVALGYYSIATFSGCVFGGIAGYYIGWDVTYKFN